MGNGVPELEVVSEADALSVTWVGHGTVLIEAGDVRVLTDPLLRPRLALLRRVAPPAVPIGGEVNAVLISHVHRDHLDVPSLRLVEARQFVVPRGSRRLLERCGLRPVAELGEDEELSLEALTVRATHAAHPARRSPLAKATPALGYLISGPARLYFAGDTEAFHGMVRLAPLDIALLPIWGWGPRLGRGHLDPRQAAQALRLLEPRLAIPIHWGTYRRIGLRGDHRKLREPAERFERLAAKLAPEVAVQILAPGQRFTFPVAAALSAR
jgi:L-ascorbate metabolism protein UlaG (beta-lactamase superfamily)